MYFPPAFLASSSSRLWRTSIVLCVLGMLCLWGLLCVGKRDFLRNYSQRLASLRKQYGGDIVGYDDSSKAEEEGTLIPLTLEQLSAKLRRSFIVTGITWFVYAAIQTYAGYVAYIRLREGAGGEYLQQVRLLPASTIVVCTAWAVSGLFTLLRCRWATDIGVVCNVCGFSIYIIAGINAIKRGGSGFESIIGLSLVVFVVVSIITMRHIRFVWQMEYYHKHHVLDEWKRSRELDGGLHSGLDITRRKETGKRKKGSGGNWGL